MVIIKDQANIHMFKVTIETIEEGVKYVQSQQIKYRNDVIYVVLVFLLLTVNIFHTFFHCFYYYFEQVKVSWGKLETLVFRYKKQTSIKVYFYEM